MNKWYCMTSYPFTNTITPPQSWISIIYCMAFYSIGKGHFSFSKDGNGWEESPSCPPLPNLSVAKAPLSLHHLSGLEYSQVPEPYCEFSMCTNWFEALLYILLSSMPHIYRELFSWILCFYFLCNGHIRYS